MKGEPFGDFDFILLLKLTPSLYFTKEENHPGIDRALMHLSLLSAPAPPAAHMPLPSSPVYGLRLQTLSFLFGSPEPHKEGHWQLQARSPQQF